MDAETLIMQLGGIGRLKAMINARNFVAGPNSVWFTFSGYSKANKIVIWLDPDDTYRVEFYKYTPKTGECKLQQSYAGIYCDMLKPTIEQHTGLYLSL